MAVTYDQLRHSVALRSNALVGTQAAQLETTYDISPLTGLNFKSADFPFSAYRDVILQAEQDFITAVAMTGNHPWRQAIRNSVTVTLTNGSALLPSVDGSASQIIGTFGSITDSATDMPMVEMPLDVILRRVRNANNHYVCPVYYYKIDGGKIFSTSPSVKIEVCVYNRATQVTAFNANGNMLLPDPAEPGIVARALSFLFRDGAYMDQAAVWRQYSDDALTAIRGGSTDVRTRSVPVPITLTKAG